MRESIIEAYLVACVKELGGETRKVQWIGRDGAPDRLVMLPERFYESGPSRPAFSLFVELKAEGLAETFPNDAHERTQWREHERMRRFGLRVEVIDSLQGVEELLR